MFIKEKLRLSLSNAEGNCATDFFESALCVYVLEWCLVVFLACRSELQLHNPWSSFVRDQLDVDRGFGVDFFHRLFDIVPIE